MADLDARQSWLNELGVEGAAAKLQELCAAGRIRAYSVLLIGGACPSECFTRQAARAVEPDSLGVEDLSELQEEVRLAAAEQGSPADFSASVLRSRMLSDEDVEDLSTFCLELLQEKHPEHANSLRERLSKAGGSSPESKFASMLGGPPPPGAILAEALERAVQDGVVEWAFVDELVCLQLIQPAPDPTEPTGAAASLAVGRTVEVLSGSFMGMRGPVLEVGDEVTVEISVFGMPKPIGFKPEDVRIVG